jgi:hypothetical protein
MTPFSINAALGAPVDAVALMLADNAESFAEYYLHGAAPSRSINPDPRDFIRQKADDPREMAAAFWLRCAVHGRQTGRQALLGSR